MIRRVIEFSIFNFQIPTRLPSPDGEAIGGQVKFQIPIFKL